MLQALKRLRQTAVVMPVLGEQLAGLGLGQPVARGERANLFGAGLVGHAATTREQAAAFRQTSFLIVASAPPSISHLAPLT